MRKQALTSFTVLGLLLVMTAVSGHAQSESSKALNIPFDFIVGQKTLPAGEYLVQPNRKDSDNVWLVQSKDGHISALFTTMSVRANEAQEKVKLVFHRYGDQYFLSQIWTVGGNSGRELLVTHREYEVAKNGVERQTIVLANGSTRRN